MRKRRKGFLALATLLILAAVVGGAGTMGAALGEEAGAQGESAAVEQVVPDNDEGQTGGSVPSAASLDEPDAQYGTVTSSGTFTDNNGTATWWYTSGNAFVVGAGNFDWIELRTMLHNTFSSVEKVVFMEGSVGAGSYQPSTFWKTGVFTKLTSLKSVSGPVDTSSLLATKNMFSGCTALVSVDMSSWDMSHVRDMESMFSGCTSLASIELGGLDTSQVTNMCDTFYNCSSLTSISLAGLNTSNVTTFYGMFQNCSSLKTINLTGVDTSSATAMNAMFSGCSSLTAIDVTGFNTSKVTGFGSMFAGCKGLSTINLSNFDTSKALSMAGMFSGCSGLTTLDVSNFKTGLVKEFTSMFMGCSGLTTIDVSGFDTSSATKMYEMFSGCKSLKTLDVSGFKTASVEYFRNMFDGCSSLETIDVSGFNTGSATNMTAMFQGCSSVKVLDVSNFNTASAQNLSYMFSGCESVEKLDVSGFDTSSATNIEAMFQSCDKISTIDLTGFDLSKVTRMGYLLNGCKGLTSIDLSGFDFSSVSNAYNVFQLCYNLQTIKIDGSTSLSCLKQMPQQIMSAKWVKADDPDATIYTFSDMLDGDAANAVGTWQREKTMAVTYVLNTADYSDELHVTYGEFDSPNLNPYAFSLFRQVITGWVDEEGNEYAADAAIFSDLPSATTMKLTAVVQRAVEIDESAEIVIAEAVYDGTALEPAVTVTVDGEELTAGTEFTCTYSDNTSAGTATVVIEGAGACTGSVTKTFTIAQRTVTLVSESASKTYDGTALEATEVTVGGDKFVEGEATAMATGSVTNVGRVTNSISIVPGTGYDEKNYDIQKDEGTLKVTERTVTLTSQSVSKVYDGTSLEATEVEVGGDGFVEGEATAKATGTITEVGTATNAIEVVPGTGFDEDNYDIRKDEGTLEVTAAAVEMFRLYNPNSGEHFYTSDTVERDATVAAGWDFEGIGWFAPSASAVPVYRLYSGTDHHYTVDETERDALLAAGWIDEGVGWYSASEEEGVPLYRQYNPYVEPEAETNNSGSHNFTLDQDENDALVSLGWEEEGIAWYGIVVEEDPAE